MNSAGMKNFLHQGPLVEPPLLLKRATSAVMANRRNVFLLNIGVRTYTCLKQLL